MHSVLHLIHDDRFSDAAIDQFDACSGCHNTYLLITPGANAATHLIRKAERVTVVAAESEEYRTILGKAYAIVFVHFKDRVKADALLYVRAGTKVVWLAWGGDFYGDIGMPLYQPLTMRLMDEAGRGAAREGALARLRKGKIWERLGRLCRRKYVEMRSMRRIGYCATVVPTEFDLVKRLPWFRARQIRFDYGFPKGSLEDVGEGIEVGNAILVGNSCTWENNHAEVFERLKELGVMGRRIVVPLSYGKDRDDFRPVMELGARCFGREFSPILEEMPFGEYRALLRTCGAAIFNHERQQAVGNIVLMLWNGGKVFLSARSPVYAYFRSIGIVVSAFPDDLSPVALDTPLTLAQVHRNRTVLSREYSHDAVVKRTQDLVAWMLDGQGSAAGR